jgi:hypothetical protein
MFCIVYAVALTTNTVLTSLNVSLTAKKIVQLTAKKITSHSIRISTLYYLHIGHVTGLPLH